jgi:hypothetical protein
MNRPLPAERRRRKIPPNAREAFLEALAAGWSVTHAAERAGYARQRFYELRERDNSFEMAWEEALEAGLERLEDELVRRATGYDEEVFDGEGKLIRRVRKYDTPALVARLKALRPERYRDSAQPANVGLTVVIREHALGERRPEIIEGEIVDDVAGELPAGGES